MMAQKGRFHLVGAEGSGQARGCCPWFHFILGERGFAGMEPVRTELPFNSVSEIEVSRLLLKIKKGLINNLGARI